MHINRIISLSAIILFINIATLIGQPADTTLSQQISGAQLITATNTITFQAGFSYDAGSLYQMVASVTPLSNNFNYSFVPPQESGELPTNTNYPVGSLNGSLNVGPTGAANYEIPFDIPPGRNGMKPNLSLIYNNQAGEGLMGLGWALSGLSSVTRMPTDYYHEGYIDVVDFDLNDKFALDGQRLISIGGDQYRTEKESFSKITLFGTSTNPTYFKVETKEGLELYFGNTLDSKARAKGTSKYYAWNLNRVKDKNGNYYDITYLQDTIQCEIHPVSIDYSGYGSTPGDYKVEFGYENRSVPLLTYINGSAIRVIKLMNLITIKYGTSVVGKMQLNYTNSKLTEIIKFGKNNTRLNSTYVNWGSTNTGLVELNRQRIRPLTSRFQGDYNGDGKTDLVVFTGNPDTCSLYLADPSGQLQFFSYQILASNYVQSKVYPGDFNGDGQDDLMIFRLNSNAYYISYLTFNGTSFFKIDDPYTLGFRTDVTYFTGDFNGDKKTDLMLKAPPPNADLCTIYSTFFQSDGSAGRTLIGNGNINWGTATALTKVNDIFLDMNGDGKTEIMAMDLSETRFYGLEAGTTNIMQIGSTPHTNNTKTNLFGDFNGDGLIDVFAVDSYILISTGKGFLPLNYTFGGLSSAYNNLYARDMNGDGKCDIVVVGKWTSSSNPVKIHVEYSIGPNTSSGYFDFQLQSYSPVSTLQYSPIVNSYDSYNRFGDYNGDGITDFYYEDGLIARLFNTYQGRSQYFVSEIKNGFGYSTHLNYLPLTVDTLYTKGSPKNYPELSIQPPLYVVSSVEVDNPDFSHNTTCYTYKGAYMHALGKGFLGFETISSTNTSLKLKTLYEYEYNTTYYDVAVKKQSKYLLPFGSSSEELISELTLNNQWTNLGNGTFWTSVASSFEADLLKGSSVTKIYNYNFTYGNLTNYREDFDDGSFNSTAYSNFSDAGTWLPAKPQTIAVSKKHYQDSQINTLTTDLTYYPTSGLLHTKNIGSLTVTYNYDSYGNMIDEISSDGISNRTNHFTYDSKNMFVYKSYNALNHVTKRTYDYVTGNVLTETQPDSAIVVNYSYNDFGTLITRSVPVLGQSESYNYGWATGTRPLGSIYYKQTVISGVPTTKEYYDLFVRVICQDITGFDGSSVFTNTVYNNKGQVLETSLPYKQSDTKLRTLYFYDNYGQKIKEASPSGIIDLTYLGKTIQVTSSGGQTSSKTYDSQGNIITSIDNIGSIGYTYKSIGKPAAITSNGSTWSMNYDNLGRQTNLSDPDAGTTIYTYNIFNELIRQVDSKGNSDSLTYDPIGRVIRKYAKEGIKLYSYDPSGKPGVLSSVTYPGGSETYSHDNYARLTGKVTNIEGVDYSTSYGYDSYNRLETSTFPSGFAVKNVFNSYGYLSEIRRNDNNSLIWQALSNNAFGQLTQYKYGNNLTTTHSYDNIGFLTNIQTGSVQNIEYSFNLATGNLTSRKDNLRNLTESFTYDNLNRLTGVNGPSSLTMSYFNNGNINTKTSVGTYSYDGIKPHAVTAVTNPDTVFPTTTQRITYNSFNKVDSIIQANLIYTISYGANNQRNVSKLFNNGSLQKTIHYADGYEKEIKPGNQIRQLHYINGSDGLAAIFVRNNGQDTLYYVHTDHLGSINVITNQSGTVVKNFSFDAWGRRRNPTNWSYSNLPSAFLFSRGYTGHEHLDEFALINMNGRVYDPILARFLSPDPFIQFPTNPQNYNRFSYTLNNPLKYTDPDGEWVITVLTMLANMYISTSAANDWQFNPTKWDWGSPKSWVSLIQSGISGWTLGSYLEARFKIGHYNKGFIKLDNSIIDPQQASQRLDPHSEDLYKFQKDYFPKYIYGNKIIHTYNNELVLAQAEHAWAFTSDVLTNGKYTIYYGNIAFSSKFHLYNAMGHELIHIAHFERFGRLWKEKFSEYATNYWNYKISSILGASEYADAFLQEARSYYNFDPYSIWRIFKSDKVFKYMKYSDYGIPYN